ncbi:MAG: PAS domain S-box protein [Chloroflexota bacterium]
MLPTLYFVAVTTSACILAVLAVFIWTQRHRPGAWPMFMIVTGYMFAMMMHSISLFSETAAATLRFNQVAELAYLTHPVHVLWLALAFQRHDWRYRRIILPLYVIALAIVAVIWTDEYHGWFIDDYSVRQFGEFLLLSRSLGWWYNITSIFALMVQVAAIGILLFGIRSAKGRLRQQLTLILVAIAIPLITLFILAGVDVAGADPIIRYPARMSAMIAASVVLAYVFVRYQPLNLMPIALPLIFSEIPDPIIIVDEDQRITDLNRAASSLKGTHEREAIGQPLSELYPELVGADIEDDLPIVDTQGQAYYFSWTIRDLKRGQNKIGTLYGLRDITRRKHAEAQLREDEAHLRSLVQTETAFVIRANMAGEYTYVNQAFADWIGRKADDLLGTPVTDTIDLLDHEKFNQAGHSALGRPSQPVRVSLSKILSDGSRRQTLWEYLALTNGDGNVHELQCMGFDITEQHELEQALKASEERLRTIVENIPIMIGFFDQSGRFEFVNQHWVNVLGWTVEELAAHEEPLSVFYPDAAYRQRVLDYMLSAKPGRRDFETLTKSGETITTSWATVRLSDGRTIGIGEDVTAMHKAQQRDIELKLERERRHLLTTFFQNAAHEFRTPLATISSSAYLMLRSDDLERRAQKVNLIERQVKQVTRLVDSLLLLTRLESNGALASSRVNVGDVLRSVCEKAEETCAKNHELHRDIAPDLSPILGDKDYLGDALQQIVDNACQFTPAGGKIELKAINGDHCIRIEIHDSGPGIASDDLYRIFETFWRKDTAHSTPGFGLGLPIAQKIIERHGGEITVESKEGQGTTVRVSLPTA